MMNFITLKILDKFRFLYEKLGVDYDDMRLILSTKLTIYSREKSSILNNCQFIEFPSQYLTLLLYTLFSFCTMLIMIINKNVFLAMSVYFSMFLFFMFTTVMSDFSSVILDIKDNGILATRGVNLKTLNAYKLTHVMIYIINTSLLLNVFGLIASIKYGLIFFLVFLIEIILMDIFIIIISGLGYLIVLKIFDGEKLKDAICIVQIVVTVLFSGSYFFINTITENMNLLENMDIGIISYFFPSFWFASPLEIISKGNMDKNLFILSSFALIIPIISFIIYMKLTPVFEKKLQKLNKESTSKKVKKYNLTMKLSKVICRDKEERIFFNFISNVMRKDRDFKLTVYPLIIMNYVLPPLVFCFRWSDDFINSYLYLFIYMCLMSIPIILFELKFSTNYKASYVYITTPIKNEICIYKACIKTCFINIIIPIFLIQSIVVMFICKANIIHHIIIIFLVSIFISIMSFKMFKKTMPFSYQLNPFDKKINPLKSDAVLEYCLIDILIFIMAIAHFLISLTGIYGISIYMIAILILDINLYKSTFIVCKNKM